MHRAKIAWSSEDVADEYELQLQHELEMLQVNPGTYVRPGYSTGYECFHILTIYLAKISRFGEREKGSLSTA